MELIGWTGSILLAICGLPLGIDAYKNKNADHVPTMFLHMWYSGEILALIYVIYQQDWPLVFNYLINALILTFVYYYKYRSLIDRIRNK